MGRGTREWGSNEIDWGEKKLRRTKKKKMGKLDKKRKPINVFNKHLRIFLLFNMKHFHCLLYAQDYTDINQIWSYSTIQMSIM